MKVKDAINSVRKCVNWERQGERGFEILSVEDVDAILEAAENWDDDMMAKAVVNKVFNESRDYTFDESVIVQKACENYAKHVYHYRDLINGGNNVAN